MNYRQIRIFVGMIACTFCEGVLCASQNQGEAGTGLEFDKRITGNLVLDAVDPLRDVLQKSSAVFFSNGDLVGYGIVMDENYILTKASLMEKREGVSVRIGETVYQPEEWSEIDADHDLVLVRIKGYSGKGAVFFGELPKAGAIVVSNGATTRIRRRARIGVISTKVHAAPHPGDRIPYVGVAFDEPSRISRVEKASPADQAGLHEGDMIVSIGGRRVASLEDMGPLLDRMKPDVPSSWSLVREGKSIGICVVPGSRRQYLGEDEDNSGFLGLDGRESKRKYGYPRVVQHDTSLLPSFMGGPLLDLKGRVIGMNIARVNRAETYALPAEDLLTVFRKLRAH